MNRVLIFLCCSVIAGGLFWFCPLFHIVRNGVTAKRQSSFNAAEVAKSFWSERLIPSLKHAPDAAAVLSAFRNDSLSARARFGRKVGVSRTSLVVLRGSGTIVTIDKRGIGVALQGEAKEADVFLQTGLLFGNTVRDATALLDASTFVDSRQFNELSTELNRIVEAQIIPRLKDKAAAGRHIDFAGCAEIPDDEKVERPLLVIPLDIRIE